MIDAVGKLPGVVGVTSASRPWPLQGVSDLRVTVDADPVLVEYMMSRTPEANYWVCPPSYYDPIDQQAVVLAASTKPDAARAFLEFLTDSDTQALLATLGYPRR